MPKRSCRQIEVLGARGKTLAAPTTTLRRRATGRLHLSQSNGLQPLNDLSLRLVQNIGQAKCRRYGVSASTKDGDDGQDRRVQFGTLNSRPVTPSLLNATRARKVAIRFKYGAP